MVRIWFWVIIAGLIGLVSCSSVPEKHYFTMDYVLLPLKGTEQTLPVTLHVRQLEIMPAYDRERIVYRYSPYEFRYYNYMLWSWTRATSGTPIWPSPCG